MEKIIEISWEQYVSEVIHETKPRRIIVIGKGVSRILEYKLNKINIPFYVKPQPQTRLSASDIDRTFERYYELCSSV